MPATARAETVGSLLRPQAVLAERQALRDGRGSEAALRAAEDAAVLDALKLQESVGLDVVSDGEMRRRSWISTIPIAADPTHKPAFSGFEIRSDAGPGWVRYWNDAQGNVVERAFPARSVVTKRMQALNDIVSPEYAFVKQHTAKRSKFTFPAPSYHRIYWHPELSKAAYPTVDNFLEHIRDLLRTELVDKAIALGCDYIQLDAPNYGQFYVDPRVRAGYEAEGHDLDANLIADAEIDSSMFDGISGVTRAIHVCRGNGPGGIWSANGGYERIAGEMFPRLKNVDTLLLEYDTDRAGGFEPLRHVQPHQTVVLGLLTTKDGALESVETLEGRIREAAKDVPLDRLALSPQCGFNSAGAGNNITPAQQEAKLRRLVEVARKVWA
ncbi:MAG TPA: cobalamin-independent methionine synthase II family protein [Dehalococcoidia bacterium]|nr:cobalamin-independent methionine synthase II family protein [Dehalococcoidia bacterium]